jgi:hypothetical protein
MSDEWPRETVTEMRLRENGNRLHSIDDSLKQIRDQVQLIRRQVEQQTTLLRDYIQGLFWLVAIGFIVVCITLFVIAHWVGRTS